MISPSVGSELKATESFIWITDRQRLTAHLTEVFEIVVIYPSIERCLRLTMLEHVGHPPGWRALD